MSLLHLVHKSVLIKFSDAAKNQFNPETSHVFRLTGVDAMGFLQIQDLKPGNHETAPAPYWINKDLVREIHEADLTKVSAHENGSKPQIQADSVQREVSPKKVKSTKKLALKPKPVLN